MNRNLAFRSGFEKIELVIHNKVRKFLTRRLGNFRNKPVMLLVDMREKFLHIAFCPAFWYTSRKDDNHSWRFTFLEMKSYTCWTCKAFGGELGFNVRFIVYSATATFL